MNKRSCSVCSLSDACVELLNVVDKNPEDVLAHRCEKFCGISSGELNVRNKVLKTFGVNALASTITQPKGVHVAYSAEELEQLPRSPLRNMAEKHGMSPAKSAEMPIEELRAFILSKQPGGGKGKKAKGKTAKKAAPPKAEPEGEPEGEPENQEPDEGGRTRPGRVNYDDGEGEAAEESGDERSEPEEEVEAEAIPEERVPVPSGSLEARVDSLQAAVIALGDMMGDFVDIQKKHRRFQRRAFGVMDRKFNSLLGSLDIIGAKVVGAEFDPLKCEESYSKKYRHTVPLGAIQKAVGDPVDEEES